ncbi:hypothetical protein ACA087_11155 [Pseudomonas chlororaphis]|uniref:hypothetical protein n=1 Tax=Pseudomonas chlororaphis TaxID=587753 RepID=UPI00352A09BE
MTGENKDRELVAEAAAEFGVGPDVLEDLLGLAEKFTTFANYGAKAEFARQVGQILDSAALRQSEP